MDWDSSTAQEFHLYNKGSGIRRCYEPMEGYGFARKGLVALLSIDHEQSGNILDAEYKRQRDGALVEVAKANEGEPLVVRLRTQMRVPFKQGARYRLDDIDASAVEALRVLGRDPHPECGRLLPDAGLREVLMVPPEEPYTVRLVLKAAGGYGESVDGQEWDVVEEGMEPIRVRSIGAGALLEWNKANPDNLIRVGDRVSRVNGASDKESMLEEIVRAQTFRRYELVMTLMRKVKLQGAGVLAEARLPNAEATERLFAAEERDLSERLNASQVE